jgi:hypothetical protein
VSFNGKTGDLTEKVAIEVHEVKRGKVCEPLEEAEVARVKKVGSTTESERGSETVGDKEELFGNEGKTPSSTSLCHYH